MLRAVRMLGVARPRARARALPAPPLPAISADTLAGLVDGRPPRARWRSPASATRGSPPRRTSTARRRLAPGTRTTILSPFDNLLCDRARAAELFGFDHRLEIYVPPAQRRWGYYVLPILHRERIVARADAAIDAGAGVLRVHALHREPGVRRSPALDRAVARALERLAAWRGAGEVTIAREA